MAQCKIIARYVRAVLVCVFKRKAQIYSTVKKTTNQHNYSYHQAYIAERGQGHEDNQIVIGFGEILFTEDFKRFFIYKT